MPSVAAYRVNTAIEKLCFSPGVLKIAVQWIRHTGASVSSYHPFLIAGSSDLATTSAKPHCSLGTTLRIGCSTSAVSSASSMVPAASLASSFAWSCAVVSEKPQPCPVWYAVLVSPAAFLVT